MNWGNFLKWLFFAFVPFAILAYFIYRAVWTLSAYVYLGVPMNNNNTWVLTQWGVNGTEFQETVYGHEGTYNGTGEFVWSLWANGFKRFYAIPYILFSYGFYAALFWGKNTPKSLN